VGGDAASHQQRPGSHSIRVQGKRLPRVDRLACFQRSQGRARSPYATRFKKCWRREASRISLRARQNSDPETCSRSTLIAPIPTGAPGVVASTTSSTARSCTRWGSGPPAAVRCSIRTIEWRRVLYSKKFEVERLGVSMVYGTARQQPAEFWRLKNCACVRGEVSASGRRSRCWERQTFPAPICEAYEPYPLDAGTAQGSNRASHRRHD